MKEDIKYFNKTMSLKYKKELYNNFFCWLYPFTNENIVGYYKNVNFKNKRVLTVTSSGDHILNAILNGAYEVDAFDSNPIAKYYSELKIAAVKTLSLEEFILFFYNKSIVSKKHFMDKNVYMNRIRKELKGDFREFWDYVFENYTSKDLNCSFLFSNDYLELKGLLEANGYMNEYDYEKLKKILSDRKVNYHDTNISNLDSINKKFDVIVLSNIPAFLDEIYPINSLKYLKDILEKIKHDKTKIVLNYFYYNLICDGANEKVSIYDPAEINKYFNNYEYKNFESSDNLTLGRFSRRLCLRYDKVLISKD